MTVLYVCVRPQRGAAAAEYESFRSASRLDEAHLVSHDLVRDQMPSLDDVAAVLVGGSPFNTTEPESAKTADQRRLEEDLERLALAAAAGVGPAVLFTCYGIGVATRALGGEVSRAFPEDTGPTTVELTEAGRNDPVFGALASRFSVLTAHKEGVAIPPRDAVLLATNEACPVQAFRIGERLYATQFHPEPTAKAFTERMAVYRDDGYFEARDYDTVAARVLAASITEPVRIIREFTRLFA
jgi:GMP synthase (glutamine-hydrolysing)